MYLTRPFRPSCAHSGMQSELFLSMTALGLRLSMADRDVKVAPQRCEFGVWGERIGKNFGGQP